MLPGMKPCSEWEADQASIDRAEFGAWFIPIPAAGSACAQSHRRKLLLGGALCSGGAAGAAGVALGPRQGRAGTAHVSDLCSGEAAAGAAVSSVCTCTALQW